MSPIRANAPADDWKPGWLPGAFLLWLVLTALTATATGDELKWRSAHGYRWSELTVPATGKAGFTLLPPAATGIAFTNRLSDALAAQNRVLQNGSGVALGDVDGDGWCDIYFCRLEGPNVLYRNLGNGRFDDITSAAGVACDGQFSTGAAFADIDGDGDLDLLVNCIGGGTRSFLNDGQGRFTEVRDTRLVRQFGSTSLALADIDGDGDLDLYVTNYRTDTHKDIPGFKLEARLVDGKVVVTPADRFVALPPQGAVVEVIEKGERDFLYLNDGKGHFAPVSWIAGGFLDEDGRPLTAPPTDWGLSVMFRDINDDGLPDIYVCNDFFYWPDRIWINENGRRFRAIPRLAVRNQSMSSMAVDFADVNRDGFDDFFVVEMLNRDHPARHRHRENVIKKEWNLPITDPLFRPEVTRNTLQLNRGDGTHAEIAQLSGLAASDWSWSAIFLDVDLDGYEDLLVATGHHYDVQDTDTLRELAKIREPATLENRIKNLRRFPALDQAKLAFRNQHDLTFVEVGRQWGFDTVGVSHGMALADLDNDGDLDVVVNNMNQPAGVYRNETTAPRVEVRLKGSRPNTRGIGAKIWLYGGAVPMQSQEMICGGRYLSSDDAMRVFAAGSLTNQMRMEVRWRSGKRSVVNGVKANRIYEIDEAQATSNLEPRTSNLEPRPVFEDVSALLHHTHHEESYDDFERQPLLPKKLSQLGPGVGWYDVDGDGWEDLFIGSGKGGSLGLYRNDGRGGFERQGGVPWDQVVTRDQTGVLGLGSGKILAGSANYEDGLTGGGEVQQYERGSNSLSDLLPAQESSVGALALGDMDGDGDLDLFVGGRVIAGRYPEAATSRIYVNEGGRFKLQQELSQLGLVSGAVWSDLDGDGFPELILACEWGPIRVFHLAGGQLKEVTKELGLEQYTGWWNGVNVGDFDGDGKLDIVASNWGLNSPYRASREHPRKLYYGDLSGRGTVGLVEAYYDEGMKAEVPERDFNSVGETLPSVREKFSSYAAYGQASVQDIYAEKLKGMKAVEANTLATMIFFNRGDHFEARALPAEAQFSPDFAVCVGDLDGDGNEDVFLSQNCFGMTPQTSRNDAGRGLWLRGDGKGDFTPVPGQESGVKVYGEQRGAALCDYDGDGRVDLVVTQNGAETKLYHNVGARPGLRVRLQGPAANPKGIGVQLWLRFGRGQGPVRESHAGSGYWSQDSAIEVLSTPQPPTQIQVRWPGGKITTTPLPKETKEISVDTEGRASILR